MAPRAETGIPLFLRDLALSPLAPATLQRQPIEEEEELLQPKLASETIQRQPVEEEEEELLQPKLASETIQRQPVEEEEEEAIQTKLQGNVIPRQTDEDIGGGEEEMLPAKLTVGEPNDVYEQEADRVAEQVMRMPEPGMRFKPTLTDGAGLSCRNEGLEGDLIQTKTLDKSSPSLGQGNIENGSGQPLPESTRAFFEQRFAVNLGQVRIHTDEKAKKSASALGAQAYTVGSDIAFGEGRYAVDTQTGKKLIAHEITHVLQQGAGGSHRIQRDVGGDVRTMTITPDWARALTGDELVEQIRLVRQQLAELGVGSDEYHTARENLNILEQVQLENRGSGLGLSLETEEQVMRPPGLPLNMGYTLQPLPAEVASLFAGIPEGQLVTVSVPQAAAGPLAYPHSEETSEPTAITSPMSGGALAMLRSLDAGLMQTGFVAAGTDAIGLVGIPRWFTPGAMVPESLSSWGHTAVYVRQGGTISLVRGFTVESMLGTLRNAGAIESGLAGTPAMIANDAGLFTRTGAMSIEYPVTAELAESMARRLPTTGSPTGTTPATYTARPAIRCIGPNCVLWAVGEAESALRGPIGPRTPGVSVTAIGEGGAIVEGTASQGRLITLMRATSEAAEHATAPPSATGPAVAGGMTRGMQVLKWGGRVMLVVGVVMIPVEVAMAPEKERTRTAVGATSGFVGGLAAGAALGLVCGPGAPACSIVTGLVGGVIGYFGARAIGEGVYDVATGRTRPSSSSSSRTYVPPYYFCFVEGTNILMADGTERTIENIRVGDEVTAYNEPAAMLSQGKVLKVHTHPASSHLRIEMENGKIISVTHAHRFFVDGDWRRAEQLDIGSRCLCADFATGQLSQTTVKSIEERAPSANVYNLTVENHHTYIAEGCVVHNVKP